MALGLADHRLDTIDWSAPWLAPLRALGQPMVLRVLEGGAEGGSVGRALHAAHTQPTLMPAPSPVRFVPQSDLPEGTAYEQHIFDTRRVPTRDNLHDFFNGLVWHQYPQTKLRLNQLQAQAIAADGVQAVRGALRDALTVFDENGALLFAPSAVGAALQARDWQRLFVDLRPLWQQSRLVLFGHALLEKLVVPRKPMVAHVYIADIAIDSVANMTAGVNADVDIDAWLAQQIQPALWSTKPFAPLPVLGVPGWWPANEGPGFYADAQVFRAARSV